MDLTRIPHRFSIGFRSGEHDGHFKTSILCVSSHSKVCRLRCTAALSCWNTHFLAPLLRNVGSKFICNTSIYSAEFIRVLGNANSKQPFTANAPQTIRDPPPKFLLEKYRGSLRKSLQYPLKPSGPSKLNFFSSEKIVCKVKIIKIENPIVQICFGNFLYIFPVPCHVDSGKIQAIYNVSA